MANKTTFVTGAWYVTSEREAENLGNYLPHWQRAGSNAKMAWEFFIRQNYPSANSVLLSLKLREELQKKGYRARRFELTIVKA